MFNGSNIDLVKTQQSLEIFVSSNNKTKKMWYGRTALEIHKMGNQVYLKVRTQNWYELLIFRFKKLLGISYSGLNLIRVRAFLDHFKTDIAGLTNSSEVVSVINTKIDQHNNKLVSRIFGRHIQTVTLPVVNQSQFIVINVNSVHVNSVVLPEPAPVIIFSKEEPKKEPEIIKSEDVAKDSPVVNESNHVVNLEVISEPDPIITVHKEEPKDEPKTITSEGLTKDSPVVNESNHVVNLEVISEPDPIITVHKEEPKDEPKTITSEGLTNHSPDVEEPTSNMTSPSIEDNTPELTFPYTSSSDSSEENEKGNSFLQDSPLAANTSANESPLTEIISDSGSDKEVSLEISSSTESFTTQEPATVPSVEDRLISATNPLVANQPTRITFGSSSGGDIPKVPVSFSTRSAQTPNNFGASTFLPTASSTQGNKVPILFRVASISNTANSTSSVTRPVLLFRQDSKTSLFTPSTKKTTDEENAS